LTTSKPLVSVVTPFYNTAAYLAECIESVLRQSYENWEYVLVNNCSTDRSPEIAERYARQDPRIRVYNNNAFIGQLDNYNGALLRIASESQYCKMVEADNWIFPNCLEKMVALAEAHPSVGIVGSYYLQGKGVAGARVVAAPFAFPRIDGKSACRMHLVDHVPFFGAPTNLLLRSSIVRERRPFYDTNSLHADRETCYAVLQACDFGYLDEILAFVRNREQSITAELREMGTYQLYRLVLVRKYGRALFPEESEFRHYHKRIEREYCAAVFKHLLLSRRKREIWKVHSQVLAQSGYKLSWYRLMQACPGELARRLFRVWSSYVLPLMHGHSSAGGRR
jgi:glycosyltransferase involved in cell wall biosynthesis